MEQKNIIHNIPPAQLWLGSHTHLLENLELYLQKIFCPNTGSPLLAMGQNTSLPSIDGVKRGCRHCITCRQIQQKQHHALCWLYPEKSYTLDELAPISNIISYALNEGQHYFFIIQKADFLTPTCANSLLKSVEEPPAGYHFILLAEHQENILPTIKSRCTTQTFYHQEFATNSALFDFFSTTTQHNPNIFLSTLEQSKITERESIELLDSLLNHWVNEFKSGICEQDTNKIKQADHAITVLKQAFSQPPMPGSSKMFWKNVFLQLKQ